MTQNNSLYEVLEWDSSIFGYGVVQIKEFTDVSSLQSTLASLRVANVRLAYIFISVADDYKNDCVIRSGGTLVDTKTVYFRQLKNVEVGVSKDESICEYDSVTVNEQIVQLAFESGEFSRFHTDQHFTNGEFQRLYTEWVTKSIKSGITCKILLNKDIGQQTRGFITLEHYNDIGRIGLFAVGKQYRRMGVGESLMNRAIVEFKDMDMTEVRVTTQKQNIAACNFYTKHGFDILSETNVYHFWL